MVVLVVVLLSAIYETEMVLLISKSERYKMTIL